MIKKIILFFVFSVLSISSVFADDYYDGMHKCSSIDNSSINTTGTGNVECIDIGEIYSLSLKSRQKIIEIISMINKYPNDKKLVFIDKLTEKLNNYKENTFPFDLISLVISNISVNVNIVTILEGYNIFDIDTYLFQKGLIEKGEYISYVQNKEKIVALSKFFPFLENQDTLEGYLYPDTYEVDSENFKINQLVINQLDAFESKVYNKLFLDENNVPKYSNDIIESVVNLASIVEKEEKNPNEKPIVAGILKKRLKEGWQLGADITVCYPYNLTSKKCALNLSKYVGIKTEYNTRFIKGLPPTPISNPSFETINATLNSKQTDYYYYLHDVSTGKVYYAKTNEEHNKNRELYIK